MVEQDARIEYLLAKSNPPQSISEHTEEVLRRIKQLRDVHGNSVSEEDWDLLRYAALYHDTGKASTPFQMSIRGNRKHGDAIPHNYLSVAFLPDDVEDELLAAVVAFHHWRSFPDLNHEKLKSAYEDLQNLLPLLRKEMEVLGISVNLSPFSKWARWLRFLRKHVYDRVTQFRFSLDELLKIKKEEYPYRRFVLLVGLLNRADHSASAGVDAEKPPVDKYSGAMQRFRQLEVGNPWQVEVLSERDKLEQNGILSASTGMGKTEFALMWAGKDKLLYTLPMRASTNAMFQRFRRLFGRDTVGLIHSESLGLLLKENPDTDDVFHLHDTARQLSFNVMVSTADQIFTSVLRYRGFERIYATLATSRVVVDEIQAYSPRTLAIIVRGLKEMEEMGGKWLVITATVPRFLLDGGYIEPEWMERRILPAVRHRVRKIDDNLLDAVDMVRELSRRHRRVLVIFNTVKRAQEFYRRLEGVNKLLIHSRFTWRDRGNRESAVMGDFEVVLISTQVVEVSLDIDFDVLLTDLAPYDVMVQRMGRVWRKRSRGNYDSSEPNVYVFRGDSKEITGNGKVYERVLVEKTWDFLNEGLLSEEEKANRTEEFYSIENLRGTGYIRTFELAFRESGNVIFDSRSQAQEVFRDIYSVDVIPEVLLERGVGDIEFRDKLGISSHESLRSVLERSADFMDDRRRRLLFMNMLKEFSVQVPAYMLHKVPIYPLSDITGNPYHSSMRVAGIPYDDEVGVVPFDGEDETVFL